MPTQTSDLKKGTVYGLSGLSKHSFQNKRAETKVGKGQEERIA